jgi:hypothetical protein
MSVVAGYDDSTEIQSEVSYATITALPAPRMKMQLSGDARSLFADNSWHNRRLYQRKSGFHRLAAVWTKEA